MKPFFRPAFLIPDHLERTPGFLKIDLAYEI